VVCLASNKPFDFGVYPDHYPDPGVRYRFNAVTPMLRMLQPAGSAALAVCSLIALVLLIGLMYPEFVSRKKTESIFLFCQVLHCTAVA